MFACASSDSKILQRPQSRSQSGAEYAQHAQNIAEHARGRPSADRKLYYFTIYMQYSNKNLSFNNNNNNVGPVNYYYNVKRQKLEYP